MKRKMTVVILCIAAAACLCGCHIIAGGPHREYLSEQDAAEHTLEEIIQYTEAGDTESFMDLFSEYAKARQPDLEEQINGMMEFYQGKAEDYKGNASLHESSKYGRTVFSEYKAHYSLTTDQEDYMVAFQYRMLDADNPDQVGLVSFEIATKEVFDREDFLWTYEDNPGVYATE